MSVIVTALLIAAAPSAGRTYAVEPAGSTIAFHVVHPFHGVTGRSSSVEGKVVLFADGKVQAMVRVPVASFDSGVSNRDSNVRDAVEEGRFPFVVFKGTAQLDPSAAPSRPVIPVTIRTSMSGELEMHGVKQAITVPLEIQLERDGTARARGSFQVSLQSFGIDRPSLLLLRIDDACRIDADLVLREDAGTPGTASNARGAVPQG
jgi:polyisoprenoid-binding protein YceI